MHNKAAGVKRYEGDIKIKFLLTTDVGLCPNGWSLEENRPMCYLLVQRRVSWLEAQEHCQTLSDNKVKCEY